MSDARKILPVYKNMSVNIETLSGEKLDQVLAILKSEGLMYGRDIIFRHDKY